MIPEDTYEHTVAQYWYEALGLAVSKIAFEHVTGGKWRAEVPSFLDRRKIEDLVQFHLHHLQDSFKSTLGQRLMERIFLSSVVFSMIRPKKCARGGNIWRPSTSSLKCFHQEGSCVPKTVTAHRTSILMSSFNLASKVAEQYYQQVRATVQAMLRRGMKPQEITIPAVAKEARVSVVTIYRRADLFTLLQCANPTSSDAGASKSISEPFSNCKKN